MNSTNQSKHRDRRTRVRSTLFPIAVFLVALIPFDCSAAEEGASTAALFESMGTHHRKITTGSTEAQQYFDQGLI